MTQPRHPCPVPQIRNGRVSDEGDGAPGLWLPADSPFGDLQLKQAKIVLRVDEANRKIGSAFEHWQCLAGAMSLPTYSRHRLDLESAMFLLRRVADELVSLHAVLSGLEEQGRYPDRIGIDGVGALLKYGSTLGSAPYRGHQETLRTLNGIDNAHRYTFMDANLAVTGAREPVVVALALRRDGLSFGPRFYQVPVRTLIEDFDRFYQDCLAWLGAWSQRHLRKAAA
jgi:hypothetical protein